MLKFFDEIIDRGKAVATEIATKIKNKIDEIDREQKEKEIHDALAKMYVSSDRKNTQPVQPDTSVAKSSERSAPVENEKSPEYEKEKENDPEMLKLLKKTLCVNSITVKSNSTATASTPLKKASPRAPSPSSPVIPPAGGNNYAPPVIITSPQNRSAFAREEKTLVPIWSRPETISVTQLVGIISKKVDITAKFEIPKFSTGGGAFHPPAEVFKEGEYNATNAANFGNVVTIAYCWRTMGKIGMPTDKYGRTVRIDNPMNFQNLIELAAVVIDSHSIYKSKLPPYYIIDSQAENVISHMVAKYPSPTDCEVKVTADICGTSVVGVIDVLYKNAIIEVKCQKTPDIRGAFIQALLYAYLYNLGKNSGNFSSQISKIILYYPLQFKEISYDLKPDFMETMHSIIYV
jgi:hypothetical protein